jgi:hypothetical protein
MKSFAGLAGYLASVDIDWTLALGVTAAAVLGSVLGGRLAGRIPEHLLRKGFGWFVIVMGAVVLGQQVPAGLWGTLVGEPFVWIIVAMLVLVGFGVWLARRRRSSLTGGRGMPSSPAGQSVDRR